MRKKAPVARLGQAVQRAEHHQHGHQRHNRQHRLHPATVFRHGDVVTHALKAASLAVEPKNVMTQSITTTSTAAAWAACAAAYLADEGPKTAMLTPHSR